MDPLALLKEIREGWPAVKAAKWAVSAGIVFGMVVGFGVATLWWSGTAATLRERVAYWQDRAQGAINTQTARHLTPEQQKKLLAALKPLATSIPNLIVSAESVPENVRYARDFIEVLKEAGINPIGPVLSFAESDSDKGVMVGLVDPGKPSDLALKFIYAVRSAGFDVKVVRWHQQGTGFDFNLFLGPQ